MILPGLYAILAPITVGFLIGPRCLTGMLGGAIASGMMLAIMMANAGGAWDNSKKYIEIEGACGGKGTETHKACVVGDTVGDPVSYSFAVLRFDSHEDFVAVQRHQRTSPQHFDQTDEYHFSHHRSAIGKQ